MKDVTSMLGEMSMYFEYILHCILFLRNAGTLIVNMIWVFITLLTAKHP